MTIGNVFGSRGQMNITKIKNIWTVFDTEISKILRKSWNVETTPSQYQNHELHLRWRTRTIGRDNFLFLIPALTHEMKLLAS